MSRAQSRTQDSGGFERLFVALMVGPDLGRRAAELARRGLGLAAHRSPPDGLRLVAPEDLHLTLFFLGPVAAARRGELEAAFESGLAGREAPELELVASGAFPDAGRPRILWLEPREPRPGALAELERATREVAVAAGFRAEERPFRPHVTVARVAVRARGRRRPAVPSGFFDLEPGLEWKPRAAALVESVPGPRGASYRVLREFPLAAPGKDRENPDRGLRSGPSGR